MRRLLLNFALLGVFAVGCGGDDGDTGEDPVSQTSPMLDLTAEGFPAIDGSAVELRRFNEDVDRIELDVSIPGLEPGMVYTGWWVFFNNRESCISHPEHVDGEIWCGPADFPPPEFLAANAAFGYAGPEPSGGAVVDENGDWTLATREYEVGATEFMIDYGGEPSPGLVSRQVEIHFFLRIHGPAGTGDFLDGQLSTYDGFCDPENSCADVIGVAFPSVEEAAIGH